MRFYAVRDRRSIPHNRAVSRQQEQKAERNLPPRQPAGSPPVLFALAGEDTPMARASCPHCRNANTEEAVWEDLALGARWDYRCPDCSSFSVSGTEMERFHTGRADPKKARFALGDDGRRYLVPVQN